MNVSEAVKEFARRKVENLDRLFHGVTKIEIILDAVEGTHSAELIAHQKRGANMIAVSKADDMYEAIDAVIEKMDHQMRRKKEILKQRRKKTAKGAAPPIGEEAEVGDEETYKLDEAEE
jgi:putative sigma-54 modulation protein